MILFNKRYFLFAILLFITEVLTVIRFDLPHNYSYHKSLPGLESIDYPDVCYVLYRSGNKTFKTIINNDIYRFVARIEYNNTVLYLPLGHSMNPIIA